MILKIRGYGKDDWWVYGEIVRIHYEEIDRDCPVTEDYDLLLFEEAVKDAKDVKVSKCTRITLRFEDNGELFSILTDSVAYLCNNHGDTIERIVA